MGGGSWTVQRRIQKFLEILVVITRGSRGRRALISALVLTLALSLGLSLALSLVLGSGTAGVGVGNASVVLQIGEKNVGEIPVVIVDITAALYSRRTSSPAVCIVVVGTLFRSSR